VKFRTFLKCAGLILPIVILLVCCSDKQEKNFHESDDALRSFLGITTLRGDVLLPKQYEVCWVIPLFFEKGELKGRDVMFRNPGIPDDRRIRTELMFGPSGDESKISLFGAFGSGSSRAKKEYAELTTHVNYLGSQLSELPRFEAYYIVAFAASNTDFDGKSYGYSVGHFESDVQQREYVLALALRPFLTKAEEEKTDLPR
jgi:hypothetical protein